MTATSLPVFVNCRDQVTYLRSLIAWLENAGHDRIILVDNDSTYEPLLDFFRQTPHQVERLGANLGSRAPWLSGLVESLSKQSYYIVTDPDVVPDGTCPIDTAEVLLSALERYPGHVKAGLGLRIDDLPISYRNREHVVRWESQFWQRRLHGEFYRSKIDTTFAMYRPGPWPGIWPSIRTGTPYLARHLPWYANSSMPTEEQTYYDSHSMPGVNNWNTTEAVDEHHQNPPKPMSFIERTRWRLHVFKTYGLRQEAPDKKVAR